MYLDESNEFVNPGGETQSVTFQTAIELDPKLVRR
jgi:hypothetical protein